jgi:hypothetical protein
MLGIISAETSASFGIYLSAFFGVLNDEVDEPKLDHIRTFDCR